MAHHRSVDDAVASVRRFSRFYTRFVGALNNDFLDTGMTLAEARLLFEIRTARRVLPMTFSKVWISTPALSAASYAVSRAAAGFGALA